MSWFVVSLSSVALGAAVHDYVPRPRFRERLPLRSVAPYLREPRSSGLSVLQRLREAGGRAAMLAERIELLCQVALQAPPTPEHTHAHWLDVAFERASAPPDVALHLDDVPEGADTPRITRWTLCGVSQDLRDVFAATYWTPFHQHLLCGPALLLGRQGATFLERSLGLPEAMPHGRDQRPRTQLWLPTPDALRPAGFLARRAWALGAGALVFDLLTRSPAPSLFLGLNQRIVAEAMAKALQHSGGERTWRVAAQFLGWSTTRIRDGLERVRRQPNDTLVVQASPRARREHLDVPVSMEMIGPLRLLDTRDPLVAAQMGVFRSRFAAEGPFDSYLLPQALLDLATQLTSRADAHILLDSRLMARRYRDDVLDALALHADIHQIVESPARTRESNAFLENLAVLLDEAGMSAHADVSDEELHLVLRSIWDASEFREYELKDDSKNGKTPQRKVSQKDVIREVLDGKDQLLIVPTGGGKSLCFQLPAILFADETPPKVTLVFSPLIALMKDQVDNLNRRGIFSAILLNSSLSTIERQERLRGLRRGDYSIVYIAPEQIHSPGLRRALAGREVALVALDEAHCLSQWGHDFRTDYFAIKQWIDSRLSLGRKRSFPMLALTATARQRYIDTLHEGDAELDRTEASSTVCDIIQQLGLRIDESDAIMASTHRTNLSFEVVRIVPEPLHCHRCRSPLEVPEGGEVKCSRCNARRYVPATEVRQVVERAKLRHMARRLADAEDSGLRARWDQPLGTRERGLVYCAFRRATEMVAEELRRRVAGLRVGVYHAGLDAQTREEVSRRFSSDGEDGLDVVVATNAFGMGIDVRRLGFVLHFDCPGTLEAYYQEAGRAGRDDIFDEHHPAQCILYFHPTDLHNQRLLARQHIVTKHEVRDVYKALLEVARDAGDACTLDSELLPPDQSSAPLELGASGAARKKGNGRRDRRREIRVAQADIAVE